MVNTGLANLTKVTSQPMRFFACVLPVIVLLSLSVDTFSQTLTQRITGTVLDKNSKQSLPGANVYIRLEKDSALIGTNTDADGRFVLEKVPVGRHYLYCSYAGYEKWKSSYLEITSAKQPSIT